MTKTSFITIGLTICALAMNATAFALLMTPEGLWSSSLYRVNISVNGSSVSGTFTMLDEPDGPEGRIEGTLCDDGRFTATWTLAEGNETASFQTLLDFAYRDGLMTGYRWTDEAMPTQFSLHRAVDGDLVELLTQDDVDESILVNAPSIPTTNAPADTPSTPSPDRPTVPQTPTAAPTTEVIVCESADDNQPVNIGNEFIAPRSITALLRYSNLPEHSVVQWLWTMDGRTEATTTKTLAGAGWYMHGLGSQTAITPGAYELTVEVNGSVIAQRTVTVHPGSRPAPAVTTPAPAPAPTPQPPPITHTPPPQTRGGVAGLLNAGGLNYTDGGEGTFSVGFDNDVTIYVHQYEDTLRGYTPLGELPGGNRANQGQWALNALRLNYSDPLGRLSVYQGEDNTLDLHWECQVPMSVASGPYVKSIAQVGANQPSRWQAVTRNQEPADISSLYPGGDDDALLARLKNQFHATGLVFEEDADSVSVPYDNGVTVYANVYRGTAWIYAYSGGMPGGSDAGRADVAIELLKRNWNDPIGRLSLDGDDDLLWECQVPMDFLSPAFLQSICDAAAAQMAEVVGQFGKVPFNG